MEKRKIKALGVSRVLLRMMNLTTQCSICEREMRDGIFIARIDSIVCTNCYHSILKALYSCEKSPLPNTIKREVDIEEIEEDLFQDFYEALSASLN